MSKFEVAQPTAQPLPVPQPNPNQELVGSFARGVWIPLAQNFAGGIVGVGGGIALVLWQLTPWPLEDIAITAAVIGGLVFCAATAVRAFRDEWRMFIAAWGERQDKATRDALVSELRELRVELDKAQAAASVESHYEALMAAERLLRDGYIALLDIHRAAAMQRGMTRGQWDMAVKICREAGVITNTGDIIPTLTFDPAWAKVVRNQQKGQGHYEPAADGSLIKTR